MSRPIFLMVWIVAIASQQLASASPPSEDSKDPKISSKFRESQLNWTRIDTGFPSIDQNSENHRFFYILGPYSIPGNQLKLTTEIKKIIKDDYKNKKFDKINFEFELWYNSLSHRCTRSIYVYPDENEIGLNNGNKWSTEKRTYITNDEKDLDEFSNNFNLYVDAASNCEESIFAFRKIILSYDDKKFICGIDSSGSKKCFLDQVFETMKYLPKNFPVIDPESKAYFTTDQTPLTIDEIKITGSIDDWDICWKWRFFVAEKGAQMKVQLGFENNEDVELFQINGMERLNDKEEKQVPFNPIVQETCLRTLIGSEMLEKLRTVSFVPKVKSGNDDIVLVEIVDQSNPLKLKKIDHKILSAVNLAYISRTCKELKFGEEKNIDWKNFELNTFWPVKFPKNSIDDIDEESLTLMATGSGMRQTILHESQWLQRSLSSNDHLIFTVKSDHIERITIKLLDEQRKVIANLGKYVPAKDEKMPFNLNLDDENIEKINNKTVYKLQLEVIFRDPIEKPENSILYQITDLSFADPCIDNDGQPQKCYNIEEKEDPKIECKREISDYREKINYQCNCDFESGAKGLNCKEKDYCKYKHYKKDEKDEIAINGEQFCDPTKAKCQEGGFDKFKFICVCKNEQLWFNYDEQQCQVVDECLINPPDDFESKICNGKNGKTCDCECNTKKGYFQIKDSQGKCLQDETKCYRCPNEQMLHACSKYGSIEFCKCPPGFEYIDEKCVSKMCDFPHMNLCSQKCHNVDDQEPYYKCECDSEYYDSVEKDIPGTEQIKYNECKLKDNAPEICKKCTGPFQICRKEKCECLPGFEEKILDDGSMHCQPKTVKPSGCPDGGVRLGQDKKLLCDCTKESLAEWWTQETNGTCRLIGTACDDGKIGDKTCSKYGSLCVADSEKPENFHCQCPYGQVFVDGDLAKNDLQNLKLQHRCMDICQLPYFEQRCSAIGARCNPVKLWQEAIINGKIINNPDTDKYCDCVPGLFRSGSICEQRKNVVTLQMSLAWSIGLQESFVKLREELIKKLPHRFDYQDDTYDSRLDFLDPIGYGQAQKKSWSQNEPKLAKYVADWDLWIRGQLFLERVRTTMKNYQIVKNPEQIEVLLPERNLNDQNRFIATVYVHLDDDTMNTIIHDRFKCYGKENKCAVPYMDLSIEQSSLEPKDFKPCHYHDVCRGMSDCLDPDIDGYFSCRCNRTYFDVEERFSFRTGRNEIITPNERCLARPTCPEKQDHEDCIERDPVHDLSTNKWNKPEPMRICHSGYRRNQRTDRCETVCPIGACSDGGRCVVVGRNGSRCVCDETHYGDRCEHEIKSETPWIVAVVVLSLLVVVAIAGVVSLFIRSSSSSKHHHPKQPQQVRQQYQAPPLSHPSASASSSSTFSTSSSVSQSSPPPPPPPPPPPQPPASNISLNPTNKLASEKIPEQQGSFQSLAKIVASISGYRSGKYDIENSLDDN